MTKPNRLDDLVVAILTAAREQNRTRLVKTALVKFVYLADVYAAQESEEHYTITRLPWRFIHYGPYAPEIESAFERVEVNRFAQVNRRQLMPYQHTENEGRYELYELAGESKTRSFEDAGISRSVALRLRADIKRFADDLPLLLDYVYFETEPMQSAEPGSWLDFSTCTTRRPEDFQHVEGNPLSKKRVERAHSRLREIAAERQKRRQEASPVFGPYDDVYYEGVEMLDERSSVPELESLARLNAPGPAKDE